MTITIERLAGFETTKSEFVVTLELADEPTALEVEYLETWPNWETLGVHEVNVFVPVTQAGGGPAATLELRTSDDIAASNAVRWLMREDVLGEVERTARERAALGAKVRSDVIGVLERAGVSTS